MNDDQTTTPGPFGGGPFAGRRFKRVLRLRVAMVALGAVLAVVLLAFGYVVIGGVLLVMAAMRGALLLELHRGRKERLARRDAFLARRRGRFGSE